MTAIDEKVGPTYGGLAHIVILTINGELRQLDIALWTVLVNLFCADQNFTGTEKAAIPAVAALAPLERSGPELQESQTAYSGVDDK